MGWNLLFPLLVVFGFAFAFSGRGQDVFKVGVLGRAADLPTALSTTKYLDFVPYADRGLAMTRLRHHELDLLVEPGRPLKYWLNDSSPKGYLVEKVMLGALGSGPAPVRGVVAGPAIRYVDWLIAGLLAMNMMFSALFGVGYAIVRYRKNGVLKRLKATPLSAFEFLAAQVVSRMVLVMGVFAAVYHGADFFLHFVRLGSLLDLYLIFALGAACLVSLGLLLAARTGSEELAGGLLNLISWPMMFLSGVWFSLAGAPRPLRLFADLLPLTHVIDAARAVMTEGATLPQVAGHLWILAAMTAVFLAAGAWLFRWE
ncbi:MAG: ABC transporter permease [Elusimicrobia bacterium]|nr:ABC transporter permease [Elusimicrobiota bacterium]